MPVKIACLVPHPPIIIPEIGGAETAKVKETVHSMQTLGGILLQEDLDSLVFISPHAAAFADTFLVKTEPALTGSMARFGAPDISLTISNDSELAAQIVEEAEGLDVSVSGFDQGTTGMGQTDELDHGMMVPLYYLKDLASKPSVFLSISGLSYFRHYLLGVAVQKASDVLGRNIAFIASGDLSHRLTRSAPAGYNEKGSVFDGRIEEIFKKGAFEDLFGLEDSLIQPAGECGFRSVLALAGSLNGHKVETDVLSYEGPFGVGYMVAWARPDGLSDGESIADRIRGRVKKRSSDKPLSEPAKLAKEAIETFVREGRTISAPRDLPEYMLNQRAAAFVCIKKRNVLRGCIGTTDPVQPSLAEEIIKNAIEAARHDPRFPAVDPHELPELVYTVDILGRPEQIADKADLDPKEYGVIVQSGFRRGLLLPDIEGVDTVENQVAIAKQKGGIAPGESATLYRFKVTRYR